MTVAKRATGPEEDFDITRAKVLRRGPKRQVMLPLASLRNACGRTQVEVAEALDVAQSEVSRVERRDDVMLSTLRGYIEALGGELELVATFPTGHKIRLDL